MTSPASPLSAATIDYWRTLTLTEDEKSLIATIDAQAEEIAKLTRERDDADRDAKRWMEMYDIERQRAEHFAVRHDGQFRTCAECRAALSAVPNEPEEARG